MRGDSSVVRELRGVLVATDLCEPSLKALQHGIAIARHCRATLYVVHVVSSLAFTLAGPDAVALAADAYERDLDAMMNQLRASGELDGVDSRSAVLRGNLIEELESFARDHEAGLIVVGTHGRQGVAGLFFGSIARLISTSCSSPVLTVGQHAGNPWLDDPAEAERPLLFATGFNENSATAAPFAVSLSQELERRLCVLHVKPQDRNKLFGNAGSAHIQGQAWSRANLGVPTPSSSVVEPGNTLLIEACDPAEAILQAAKRVHAAVIILGMHRDPISDVTIRLPWSIGNRVNREAMCPVLTLIG